MSRTIRITLDTSDFYVEARPDGRVFVQIDSAYHSVELDLAPGVALDLAGELVDPDRAES
jgi:hypothetical protein